MDSVFFLMQIKTVVAPYSSAISNNLSKIDLVKREIQVSSAISMKHSFSLSFKKHLNELNDADNGCSPTITSAEISQGVKSLKSQVSSVRRSSSDGDRSSYLKPMPSVIGWRVQWQFAVSKTLSEQQTSVCR
eukprot:TRINITY_DN0_c2431_g1_i3.p1 TRINITY_DN0_c2431_g1~~TRINITY_DN0_c2431_g1_i3.p1  ORF type:complete len:132 (+),score=1.86 TRINITY_DN0_c2431_g1_i3:440-835(+)